MNIAFDDQELVLLGDVVEAALRDLHSEIADTDNPAYKRGLKARRAELRAVLDRLRATPAA
jgi:hypothetical protein